MKTKNPDALLIALQNIGINVTFEQLSILLKAERTLHRWCELECGDGNQFKSWNIQRNEETGLTEMCVHLNNGQSFSYKINDRERAALKRVHKICEELNIYYYYQTDPRGCALYISAKPITDINYTNGIACCI